MIIESDNIINELDIEVGKVVKLELTIYDGIITIPKALIKSINESEIEIEPLASWEIK